MSGEKRPDDGRQGQGKTSWLIMGLLALAMAVALLIARGGLEAPDSVTFWRILCDALFVPGALLTCWGLLIVLSAGGAFDALSYGVKKLFSLMRSEEKRAQLPRTYYDYVTERHGKKRAIPTAILGVGICFLAAAIIALLLYYHASG